MQSSDASDMTTSDHDPLNSSFRSTLSVQSSIDLIGSRSPVSVRRLRGGRSMQTMDTVTEEAKLEEELAAITAQPEVLLACMHVL